jgi:hypothetical protein
MGGGQAGFSCDMSCASCFFLFAPSCAQTALTLCMILVQLFFRAPHPPVLNFPKGAKYLSRRTLADFPSAWLLTLYIQEV